MEKIDGETFEIKFIDSRSVAKTCSSLGSDFAGICFRRTALVLSKELVLRVNRIGRLDTHTSGMTSHRGEKYSGDSNPVSVNATATKKKLHYIFPVNVSNVIQGSTNR